MGNALFIVLALIANAPFSCSIRPEVAGLLAYRQKGCPSSSCGDLTDILYPFRLSTDPSGCGNVEYELVCEDDQHAVIYLSGLKLFVKRIDYLRNSILVSYNKASSPNSCILPNGFHNSSIAFDYKFEFTYTWATFLNCTQKVENSSYMDVPCLSSKNAEVHVIIGDHANCLAYLPNHCYALEAFCYSSESPSSGTQVLQLLQQGFQLQWQYYDEVEENQRNLMLEVPRCWRYAIGAAKYETDGISILHMMVLYPIRLEAEFVGCFYEQEYYRNDNHVIFSVILIIFANIFMIISGWAVIYRFVLAPIVVCTFLVYNYMKDKVPDDTIEKFLRRQKILSPTRYTYGDINALTGHFKEKLGQGGFGSVFKGELPGGRLVAIKVLQSSNLNGEEFINEVSTIGRIHHVNVVQLIGYCIEGTKRALIYEYMPNGSLDKYIYSSNKSQGGSSLSLEQLNKIASGVAKGIDYLHRGCDMQILHFDIKPHNILLDKNFCPKIADFGLAKLYPRDHSIVSISATRGTIGYIAPELISRNFGLISYKSDVYSFGMLLMEIAGRRRNVDHAVENSSQIYYPSWIYDQLNQLEVPNYDDMNIDELEKKLCKVGLWCIQMNPVQRPSMSKVIEMLEADVDDIPLAPKPFLSSPEVNLFTQSYMSSSSVELSNIEEHN